MCLDAEEHLWIAIWDLGQVHRYSRTREFVSVIDVPAPDVSSVAFAGRGLDTPVVTTAT
jgi:sugar lactone lactonase YvrE